MPNDGARKKVRARRPAKAAGGATTYQIGPPTTPDRKKASDPVTPLAPGRPTKNKDGSKGLSSAPLVPVSSGPPGSSVAAGGFGGPLPYHQLSFGSVPLPLPPGPAMGAALPFAGGSPVGGGVEPTFSFGVGGSGASGSRKKQGKKKAPSPFKAAAGAGPAQGGVSAGAGAGDDVAKTFVFVPSVAPSPVAMEMASDSWPKVIHIKFYIYTCHVRVACTSASTYMHAR